MKQAPTGLVSCCNLIFGMLHAYWHFLSLSRFLSLSSIHILRIESLIHTLRAWDRVQTERVQTERVQFSERARTRVNGRSRAGVLVDLFRFQFDFFCVSILMRWPDFFELAAGFDLAPFRKNEKTSRPFFPKTTVSWLKQVLFIYLVGSLVTLRAY